MNDRPPIHRQAIYDGRVPDRGRDNTEAAAGSLVTFGRYAGPAT